MTEDEYEAKLTEYEAKLAEFDAKADKLERAERTLVAQDRADEALRRDWGAKYDVALQARDEGGIAAYMVAAEELRIKWIARNDALAAVRAEYDALERERPRRPRRTWGQLLGKAWTRYRRAKQCQRELMKAFAEKGVDFTCIDSKTQKKVIKEAMVTDIATVVGKWMPIFQIFSEYNQKRDLLRQQMNNLGKPPSEWDVPQPLETHEK
jgi:hypothetical protein